MAIVKLSVYYYVRILRSSGICLIKGDGDTKDSIIEELGGISWMIFVVGTLFPFLDHGFVSSHSKLHAIIFNSRNSTVRNITIFGKEIAFMDEKRVFKYLRDMSQVLVVG